MWLNYYKYKEDDSLYYSVDMLTLDFEYNNSLYDFLQSYLYSVNLPFDVDYFCCLKSYCYKHLFKFTFYSDDIFNNKSVLIIKLDFNNNKIGQIEFNPNKVLLFNPYFFDFYRLFILRVFNLEFRRSDFAVDIPLARNLVVLQRDSKKYTRIEYAGAITEYLGQRNKHGQVKLYDKGKESQLPHELTRYEVTYEKNNILNLPKIYIKEDIDVVDDISSKDKMIISLLLNSEQPFNFLKQLKNYNTRKRLTLLLQEHLKLIEINQQLFFDLLIDYQKELFFALDT